MEKKITKADLGSYEEAIKLYEEYDHADTKEFVALKKEYRKAKREYKKAQRKVVRVND